MALTEETSIESIEIISPHIVVQRRTIVKRDGVEIARNVTRNDYVPGVDTTAFESELKAVCQAVWTAEVVAAFEASIQTPVPTVP